MELSDSQRTALNQVKLRGVRRRTIDRLFQDRQARGDDVGPVGDQADKIVAAAHEVRDRRKRNTADGAEVFAAVDEAGIPLRAAEGITGVPRSTIARWGAPMGETSTNQ